jgi:hypothetical protein
VNKGVPVQSMDGPYVTVINGGANLSGGASLSGFTLNASDRYNASVVWGLSTGLESTNGFLTNCVITGGNVPGANGADGL